MSTEEVFVLDARFKHLYGKEEVIKILKKADIIEQPLVLLLDSNHFTPTDLFENYAFLQFLDSDKCKYVSVVGNAATTTDATDFLSNFDLTLMRKLIWIPKPWVKPKGWKTCLQKAKDLPEREQVIEETHDLYSQQNY